MAPASVVVMGPWTILVWVQENWCGIRFNGWKSLVVFLLKKVKRCKPSVPKEAAIGSPIITWTYMYDLSSVCQSTNQEGNLLGKELTAPSFLFSIITLAADLLITCTTYRGHFTWERLSHRWLMKMLWFHLVCNDTRTKSCRSFNLLRPWKAKQINFHSRFLAAPKDVTQKQCLIRWYQHHLRN